MAPARGDEPGHFFVRGRLAPDLLAQRRRSIPNTRRIWATAWRVKRRSEGVEAKGTTSPGWSGWVIRALAAEPSVILMDEPFSALDPISREQLQDELIRLQKEIKKTIVFVTHDMDEAIKIADNILLMKDGEIVQSGSPEEILRHPANDFVKEFIGKKRLSKVQDMATVEEVMVNHPRTVHPTRGLAQSMTMMEKNKVDSLLVVDNQDKLLGNITIYDVVKAFDDESLKVQDIMKPFEHSVTPDTLLPKAIQLMDELKAPYLPVVNDTGHLVGLLTRGSIVGYVSSEVEVML